MARARALLGTATALGMYAVSGLASATPTSGPKGPLTIAYEEGGVVLGAGAARRSVSVARFGCDGDLAPVSAARRATRGGRSLLERRELTEWYLERGASLEQGFVVPRAPRCRRRGGSGVVIVLGDGRDGREAGGAGVSSDGRVGTLGALRYADLHARDAAMRDLPARLEIVDGALAIRVDDRGARYPVEIDPVWEQQQSLQVAGASGQFGTTVAISGDTVLVSAPVAGPNAEGQVYVFTRSGAAWSQGGALSASDPSNGATFGAALAILGDMAIISAPLKDDVGAAYAFARSGSAWSQTQEIAVPKSGPMSFGGAVALGTDTAMIASNEDVFVYALSGGTWTLSQTLVAPPVDAGFTPIPPSFGASMAISNDTAVIGAPDPGAPGSASIYVQSGGVWSLQQVLLASDGAAGDQFGGLVAISGDTVFVAASHTAEVYVFTRSGTTWTQAQSFVGPAGYAESLGLSGKLAAVGVSVLGGGAPSVQAYAPHQGKWGLDQILVSSSCAPCQVFGGPLAMDGDTLVTGSGGTGAAYVYTYVPTTGSPCGSASECPTGFCVNDVCCNVSACPPAGVCNAAETCELDSGICSVTPRNDGAECDAGALCSASCAGGACVVSACVAPDAGGCSAELVCAPTDACHDFGSCDPSTGACVDPPKADGQPCSGGFCQGGVCTPAPATTFAGGCGCEVPGPSSRGLAAFAMLLLALAGHGYRRRR